MVRPMVIRGLMLGRTEWWISCTRPPVMLPTSVMLRPSLLPRTTRPWGEIVNRNRIVLYPPCRQHCRQPRG